MKKIIYLLFLSLFVFTSCNQEDEIIETAVKGKQDKVTVCHKGNIISINGNALKAHLNHGDVQLIDEDGDGYVTLANDCVPGGDCDDTDPAINPDAEEICGNDIDDDCDGLVDEDCKPEIGDFYQGGVLFYIFGPFDKGYVKGETHGLICNILESGQAVWGCFGTDISGTLTSIGSGAHNTFAIVNNVCQMNDGIISAAEICANINDAYSDWFLPSKDELNLMYSQKDVINATSLLYGGDSFTGSPYWSSSEYSNQIAYYQYLGSGAQGDFAKFSYFHVRAIRAF